MTASDTNLRSFSFGGVPNDEMLKGLQDEFRRMCGQSIRYWADNGLVHWSDSRSFAVVVKVVDTDVDTTTLINDPEGLIDFSFREGAERDRYAANALRKMRAVARTGVSTLELRELNNDPLRAFEAIVGVEDDSRLLWGEFPYGGAVVVECKDGRCVIVGVSGFTQRQDHWVATTAAEFCAMRLDEAAEASAKEAANLSTDEAVPAPGAVG